jgi:hypothetical protein
MECRSNVYFSVLVAQAAAQGLLVMVVHVGQLHVGPILRLFGDCAIPAMRAAGAVANCSSTSLRLSSTHSCHLQVTFEQ